MMTTRSWAGLAVACACLSALPSRAQAPAFQPQPQPQPLGLTLPEIDVVSTAPLAGSGLDRGKVPVNTQILRSDDLARTGPASALRALDENIGGINLNQASGNPFQPNLLYRGFEASPLAGNPQGLAVYVNGARFNQPFGDNTNWDLIPGIAIDRIELVGANPAFGLNALGGAITVKLRDGFTYHGAQLELSGGSFGRIQASGQYGVQSGDTSAYVAATGLNEDGWREHSPSQLRQLYADLGWRGDRTELHLGLLGATNVLTGNGTTPVDLLAADRAAVFTYPDQTRNKYLRLTLNGTHQLNDDWSLQATAYYSAFSQRTYNGNASDATACADDATLLCNDDGAPYTGRDGARIPNTLTAGGPYAELDQTATDTSGYGLTVQATRSAELFGHGNRFLAGASFDGGSTVFSARSSLGTLTPDRDYAEPGIVIAQADGSLAPVRVSATNEYYGAYASDTFDVTQALAVTLSGRLNVARIDLNDQTGTALTGGHSFTRFNPAAGLTYQILPGLSAYAGYAESNRAPTPAEFSCASAASPCTLANFFVADPALKQVVARTVEAGFRGKFDTSGVTIDWRTGLFHIDTADDILFTSSVVTGRGFFQNVGGTRREGVEAGFKIRRGDLTLFVDYAYTEATFQSAATLSSPNNPFADPNGLIQVRPGNRLPGVPLNNLKFGVQYNVTPAWTVGLTGVASSGRALTGDEANLDSRTAPYVVLNLNTSYRVTKGIEVFGLVQNLLDAKYETFGSYSPTNLVPATLGTNPRSLAPGAPIAGYGGLRMTF